MIFDRKWRLQRIECQIAGKKAQLSAVRELVNACERTVPGTLVIDMKNLPREIAELETRVAQLKATNVEVSGLAPLAAEGPLDCRVGPLED